MKIPGFVQRQRARSAAMAVTVLIGVLSASAPFKAAASPGISPGTPANSGHSPTTLAPTAPISSPPTMEDIRDIRQPRHLPLPTSWVAVVVGALVLSAAALLLWRRICHGKLSTMLPHEIALRSLEESRRLMDPEHAREYCFAVSGIVRRYIEMRFQVHAPALTTEEFLRDLVEGQDTMLESHRSLLDGFLLHCDLAKFASWRYSKPDLEVMHACARGFVQATASAAGTPNAPGYRSPATHCSAPASRARAVPYESTISDPA